MLDSIGALAPLMIADITRGTGLQLGQGATATVQGIGASLSGLAAGTALPFSPPAAPHSQP
jgi:hypothetical protein